MVIVIIRVSVTYVEFIYLRPIRTLSGNLGLKYDER